MFIKHILLFFSLMLLFPFVQHAQEKEVLSYIEYGQNSSWGSFADFALLATFSAGPRWHFGTGASVKTAGNYSFTAGFSYDFPLNDGASGTLSVSNRYLFSIISKNLTNTLTGALTCDYSYNRLRAKLGLSSHYFFDSDGGIFEPLSIAYFLEASLFKPNHKWDLAGRITNMRPFFIERHYSPSFSIIGSLKASQRMSLIAEAGTTPSGMFHLSANWYNLFINMGIKYLW